MFTYSKKRAREIRKFHVVVVQRRQRNVQNSKLLFVNINILIFAVLLAVAVVVSRELKIETFSGRRQLQPDVTSSFVGYCACSCSPPCRRDPVGDVKQVCLALWRKREYLTFISIRFVAFSNQHFADYRS